MAQVPVGFPAIFFQPHWAILGRDIINHTKPSSRLITLGETATKAAEYRPISPVRHGVLRIIRIGKRLLRFIPLMRSALENN